MPQVLDYGAIKSAQTMPDGSIRIYGRIAVANRPYKYQNQDGSIRTEQIKPQELFKPSSVDGLKIQTLTYPHSPGVMTPDNYQDYSVGSTGNTIITGLDGDFLGVMAAIRSRDAIDAYHAGVRELSPGYFRNLVQDSGKTYQVDRQYYELALVDRARGGADCRVKDGIEDLAIFDPTQIDDALIRFYQADSGLDHNAIDKLLTHGTLTPPPIQLPMYSKITIGDTELEINPACTDAAAKVATVVANLTAQNKDSIALQSQVLVLTTQNNELRKVADSAAANNSTVIATAIKSLKDAGEEISIFATAGFDMATAKTALDSCDLDAYKAAVVKSLNKDAAVDPAHVSLHYNSHLTAFKAAGYKSAKDMDINGNFQMPMQYQQLNGNASVVNSVIGAEGIPGMNGETAIINGQRGTEQLTGLPPITWNRIGG
jgi:Uncharacterized protein conserved in bacteria (DUF2213)